jgi:transposase
MTKPMPAINDTPEALQRLLHSESAVQRHRRVQTLSLVQTPPVRTRRQVARVLGVSRHTVGRWLAAYEAGGGARMLTIAKAPGQAPLLSPAIRQALCERVARPAGLASYKAIWQWLHREDGLSMAYRTGHTLVRYHLHATLKVPRTWPIKKHGRSPRISGALFTRAAGESH